MRVARAFLTIALLVSCYGLAYAAPGESREESLPLGGSTLQEDVSSISGVRLHLQYGDFRIVAGDSDQVTIRTDGKNAEQAKNMRVRIKRIGNTLDFTFLHVPKNEVYVTITIPRETSLFARMRAGDLSVDGVAGDKDLELWAGDLNVQVADASDYGPIDLSVKVGDVSAGPFGSPKGTVGNSLRHAGSGKYRLHAHVFAGDLTLR